MFSTELINYKKETHSRPRHSLASKSYQAPKAYKRKLVMNLVQAQPHSTASNPIHVAVYHDGAQQQKQLISYKITQLGTGVQQEQGFVVAGKMELMVGEEPQREQYMMSQTKPALWLFF